MKRADETISILEQILKSNPSSEIEWKFEGEVYTLERILEEIKNSNSSIGKRFRGVFKRYLENRKGEDLVKYLETEVFGLNSLPTIRIPTYEDQWRAEVSELIENGLDQYKITRLIKDTIRSWVFNARDSVLDREVALKILKPGQDASRQDQFLREGKKLALLEEHDNITTIYAAKQTDGLNYIAMKLLKGSDLEELIKSGKTFSFNETLGIMTDVVEAVSYVHSKGLQHNDLKLANIQNQEGASGKYYVIDFGGRLTGTSKGSTNDVVAIGLVFRQLLEHREKPKKRIPRRLEKMVKMAEEGIFDTPKDLKSAIKGYKRGITRRRFGMVAGGVVALGLVGGAGFLGVNHYDYRNSIDYALDEIAKVEASDYKNIDPLFKELMFRIFDQKIRWLAEEKIPKDKFPYAVSDKGTEWNLTDGSYWTSGFWPGILWKGYQTTKDEQFKDWALEWANEMEFSERDHSTINTIRFYYSHALGYDITKDVGLRDTALEASRLLAQRFNPNGNFIQITGKLGDLSRQRIYIDSMDALPLLCWAYGETRDSNILEKILAHCDTTTRFNINRDEATMQVVEFDSKKMFKIRGIRSHGFDSDSCLSRGQARAINGFTIAYKETKNKECLETAERCAKYFIDNLPEDSVPFYDFKDPNENIPKDSSAAAIAISGLLNLFGITSREEYKLAANKILQSLSTNYFSREEDYQGLLLHGCTNKNKGSYIDASLIYGDHYFIEALTKI